MRDITDMLLSARAKAIEWSKEQAESLLAAISDIIPESTTEWDWGAGERWGRVIRRQNAVALVRMDFPFFAIRSDFANRCTTLRQASGVEMMALDDFDEDCLCLDASAWDTIFPGRLLSDDTQLTKLSMSDLWWETV